MKILKRRIKMENMNGNEHEEYEESSGDAVAVDMK